VTATTYALTGADAGNYSLTSVSPTTADITALAITGSFTADDKVYDGTTSATVLTTALQTPVGGDDVTLSVSEAEFADKHVGTGKTVTATTYALTGADAGNYSLTSVSTTTADITALAITGSFTADDKVYDGTTSATVLATALQTPVVGDDVALSVSEAEFADKHVGTGKTVTATTYALTGADAGNYSLTSVSPTTADITALAITGSFTADDKVYDGTTSATVLTTALQTPVGGDDVTLSVSEAEFADEHVGTGKTVTATTYALTGADAGNYSLTSVSPTTADITALGITGSFTADDKVYDGTTSATVLATALQTPVVGDDVALSVSEAEFADKHVGTGKTVTATTYALTGADAGNYSLTSVSTTTADITALAITGSFTADDKVYDGTTLAAVLTTALQTPVGGDDVTLSVSEAEFADEHVGTGKTVTATTYALTGADAGNYSLTSVSPTTADITALGITGSFTADDKVYDGTTSATVLTRSLVGEVSGDDVELSGGTASFDTKDVGDDKTVTLTGAGLVGADAGNYLLLSVSMPTADITVRDVTASITAANKPFDGTTAADVSCSLDAAAGDSGKIATDDLDCDATNGEFAQAGVGQGLVVTADVALTGNDAHNYNLASGTAATTADIVAATTVVTVATPSATQYSDLVDLSATVSPASLAGEVQAGSMQFLVNGATVCGDAGQPVCPSTHVGGVFTLAGLQVLLAPGSYNVEAVFTSTNPNFASGASADVPVTQLVVTQEDARADYSGLEYVSTPLNGDMVTVLLTATIRDITAVLGDPLWDAHAGDITNARVKFVVRDNDGVSGVTVGDIADCLNLVPTLMDPLDPTTGVVQCSWTVTLPNNVDLGVFNLGIVVNGHYVRNDGADDFFVTVARPTPGMISGGGHIVNQASAGQYAGADGLRTNFGFNVRYNRAMRNLQGNLNVIIRGNDGRVYQIKATAMDALAINDDQTEGNFQSKANLRDITDPDNPISLGGNLNLQVRLTDNKESDDPDRIAITLRNQNGTVLFYASNWNGATTVQQELRGGNIVIR
jgi:hypothetical protein